MLLRPTDTQARASLPAAHALYKEIEDVLRRMKENPYQFPQEDDLNLPEGQYRKALFAKRYKALFMVDGETIYLDAVVDCRMDNQKSF